MTYGICEEAVYHVYCKTRLASRSNFIVFRIFKIGFQLGSTFDPVLSDGTARGREQSVNMGRLMLLQADHYKLPSTDPHCAQAALRRA